MVASHPPQPASPWLHGRAADWLLGSGGAYLLTVPLLAAVVLKPGGPVLTFLTLGVSLLISGPHYGATLLRVYESRETRHRYAFFAVWFTIALIAVAGLALELPLLGSLLITLYVTWSPWHFGGQNYGLALMQLRRQGVTVDDGPKRLLHTSFVLSFLLVVVVMNTGPSGVIFAPEGFDTVSETGRGRDRLDIYHVLSLELPGALAPWIVSALLAGYIATTSRALRTLADQAGWWAVAPSAAIVATQSMWFTLPALLQLLGIPASASLVFSAVWTSAFHALQYLWVTSYYAKKSSTGFSLPVYLGRAALAGAAVTAFPLVVFSPALLGDIPFDTGLATLLFAVVNLHHFVLDGAIWKLRDGQVARTLLRDAPPTTQVREPADRRRWLAAVVAATGGVGAAAMVAGEIEQHAFDRATRPEAIDLPRAEIALDRLGWLGRDSAWNHIVMGARYASSGDPARAHAAFDRSLALLPNSEAWLAKAILAEEAGDLDAAIAACEQALREHPGDKQTRERLERLRERRRQATGRDRHRTPQ